MPVPDAPLPNTANTVPALGEHIAVERLLTRVAEYHASDLHLTVGTTPVLRLDGKLVSLTDEEVVTPEFMESILDDVLSEEQRQQLEKERDIVFIYTLGDKARFKVNVFFQKGYPSASLRFIDNQIRSIAELGLPSMVEKLVQLTKGLLIVSGPFGSGRSSTLAALVDAINRTRSEYILTIEQPVERLFVNNKSIVEQREVGRDTPSFLDALTNSIQEDVNVVMLSEIDSPEVLRGALNVAQAGRLVLFSMNAESTVRTVEKIVTSFPQGEQESVRIMLSEVLQGIVCQRILPKVGGGTVPVAEVLTVTAPIRKVIRDGALFQITTILQTSREEGMMPLDRALAERVKSGVIAVDDALMQANDQNAFKVMLKNAGIV